MATWQGDALAVDEWVASGMTLWQGDSLPVDDMVVADPSPSRLYRYDATLAQWVREPVYFQYDPAANGGAGGWVQVV